jgi:TetR/AcrR family transcriptional regulator, transcriptional repressor for nem operon
VRRHSKGRTAGFRDPERTRNDLLQAAFGEVYRSGFQSAGLNAILAKAGVTKGALYHHFGSKEALGYAIVEEIIGPANRNQWLTPLQKCKNPIHALSSIVQGLSVRLEAVRGGCALNNLSQEMSPLDAGFRKRLERVFHDWRQGIATALREGQANGSVRRDMDPAQTAGFLIAMVQGYASMAKNAQDPRVTQEGIKNIVRWLQSLDATHERSHGAKARESRDS